MFAIGQPDAQYAPARAPALDPEILLGKRLCFSSAARTPKCAKNPKKPDDSASVYGPSSSQFLRFNFRGYLLFCPSAYLSSCLVKSDIGCKRPKWSHFASFSHQNILTKQLLRVRYCGDYRLRWSRWSFFRSHTHPSFVAGQRTNQ